MKNFWRILGGSLVLLALGVSVFLLAKPNTSGPSTDNGQLAVVAAENCWGNIAAQLGAGHVHVTSIISDPNSDPHLYESNAQDASNVTSAKVVIVNGLGYDDFMQKLLDTSSNKTRQVITVADVLNAPEGSNQHLWYDVQSVHIVASQITNAYIAKDPIHKNDYLASLNTFDASLQPIDRSIANIKQHYVGTPVAYTEPVPGYLLNSMGLDIRTPVGFAKSIEDGDDPSPADANAMESLMINKAVKLLVYNAQATSPVTERVKVLAVQNGIPVVGVTEIMPTSAHSYQSWMQDEINAIQSALGK